MLLQSRHFARVLNDKLLLISLIDKLLSDILSDTRELDPGNSPFHCKDEAPSITIGQYLKSIHREDIGILKFAHCSNSIFVISLIYIDRLQEAVQGFILNYHCVHRLLISTVMVAAKFADDFFYKNEYYAKIGGITKAEMNHLEMAVLGHLNYNLFIEQAELCVYLDRLEAYLDVNDTHTHSK